MPQECTIAECVRPRVGKGYCAAHYYRWRRHGSPLGGWTQKGALPAFLEGTVLTFEGDECLTWPFARNSEGYGQIRIDGKKHLVCRIICERIHGSAPTITHEAAHNCGKGHEGCVNPNHLRWATRKENQADRVVHGTDNSGHRNGRSKLNKNNLRRAS